MCDQCKDTGMIFRPTLKVSYVRFDRNEHTEEVERVDVEEEIGGVDACPQCAKLAEAEWGLNNV